MGQDLPPRLNELWGVTPYFNATGAPRLRANLELFSRSVRRQGLNLMIVELAFGDMPFTVDDSLADVVVRRRASAVLWQKERLLNIGFSMLPPQCDAAAWLDGDVIFENENWVADTLELLRTSVVVQPFSEAVLLPAGLLHAIPGSKSVEGMVYTMAHHERGRRALASYESHGHTGFAWAARREVLDRNGLYDRAIVGGGDMITAHAFYGDADFFRGMNMYSRLLSKRELAVAAAWARGMSGDVQERVDYVPGRILHLFHGDLSHRRYEGRLDILREADYDPATDIALDAGGCWKWSSAKPALHRRMIDYFEARAEAAASVA